MGTIGYAIASGILGFVGGLVLWLIKRDRRSLTYKVVASGEFPREGTSGKYFVCTLRNSGNRPIEAIAYRLTIRGGQIESTKFSLPELIRIHAQDDSRLEGNISLLNPEEELDATVTIVGATSESALDMHARAVGTTAQPPKSYAIPESLLVGVTATAVVAAATTLWTTFRQSEVTRKIELIGGEVSGLKKGPEGPFSITEFEHRIEEQRRAVAREQDEVNRGKPDREELIFSILNRNGLGNLLPRLLSTGDELPYWKTGLFLLHSYLVDKKNASKYVKVLDELSKAEEITPSSLGWILYLAGKIEQDQGNSARAFAFFERCKKQAPLMYDHLMAQDGSYDLRALQKVISAARLTKSD